MKTWIIAVLTLISTPVFAANVHYDCHAREGELSFIFDGDRVASQGLHFGRRKISGVLNLNLFGVWYPSIPVTGSEFNAGKSFYVSLTPERQEDQSIFTALNFETELVFTVSVNSPHGDLSSGVICD